MLLGINVSIKIVSYNALIQNEAYRHHFGRDLIHCYPKIGTFFIEPCIVINSGVAKTRVFPDLVICNTREVISVLELKYKPRAAPEYKKDIATLSIIAKHRESTVLSNQRFRGQPIDKVIYGLSKHILFVWAGVHTSPENNNSINVPLYSSGYSELQGCFIELHAETSVNSFRKIYERS